MPQQRRHSGSGLLLEQFPQLEEILENEQGEHDQLLSACVAPKDFPCLHEGETFYESDLQGATKLICSNPNCRLSPYMHGDCFISWQGLVLNYLKSSGRARSWSDKQKLQNLWTRKGYDLVFKACACNCMSGHLRKDLEWEFPRGATMNCSTDSEGEKKRRRRKTSKNSKMTLTIGLPAIGQMKRSDAQGIPHISRIRTSSLSSTASGSSTFSLESPPSSLDSPATTPPSESNLPGRRANPEDRSRHDSGGSIFLRRSDFSSFNVLPKHKINSYHIKMEDECSIGNDETRCFILSNYATNKMNRVPCVLCGGLMNIFERYPLIDGTFFLSPRQHAKTCIQVKVEGRSNYLSGVCMGCLEGWNTSLHCRYCLSAWDGSQLILGTMYSYDIFAAVPCCPDRLKCASCHQLVIHPDQRFNFFSDYSQTVSCPSCGVQDFHFTKPLNTFVTRDELAMAASTNQNIARSWAAGVRS